MAQNNLLEHEYPADLSTTIGRTTNLQICTEPNDVEGLFYFKVYDRFDSKRYCRISMTEPTYIGEQDEKLILSERDVLELIEFFKQEQTNSQNMPLGINNWELLIEDNNLEADSNSYMYIDNNLEIPDYSKLMRKVPRASSRLLGQLPFS